MVLIDFSTNLSPELSPINLQDHTPRFGIFGQLISITFCDFFGQRGAADMTSSDQELSYQIMRGGAWPLTIRSLIVLNFRRRDLRLKFVQFRKGRYPRDQQREIFHFGQMPEKSMTLGAPYGPNKKLLPAVRALFREKTVETLFSSDMGISCLALTTSTMTPLL